MSSATSTDAGARLQTGSGEAAPGGTSDGHVTHPADHSLQPWQFFVLVALACATAVTFMARGQGAIAVILLSALMGTAALAGLAALRTLLPLVTGQEERTQVIGERTRASLEREKKLALRAIKDLEFDRAMGKLSEEDFREMSGRLRQRAARLMQQLDAGAGYRDRIERDLAKRLGDKPAETQPRVATIHACAKCSTVNDTDAKFCKQCGAKL
jgi:ribosomal protein L40E